MRSVVVLVVATIACGRVGFDPLAHGPGGGDAGAGFDPDAGPTPLACTATTETCNGLDDDCNGIVDDGCPCTPVATSVTESPSAYTTQVAWTGDTLYMLQGDAATIAMWSVTANGTLGTQVPIYSGAVGSTDGDSSFAWSGSVLGIAFSRDTTAVQFAIYDPAAKTLSTPTTIDTMYPGRSVHVTWTGDRFLVAWQTANDDLIAREMSAASTPMSAEQIIAPATGGIVGSVWATKSGTVACVRDRTDATARFVRSDGTGVHAQPLAIGTGTSCELLPIPGGYLAWYHTPAVTPAALEFITADGAMIGTASLPAQAYNDVSIQRLPDRLWALASFTPALYTHSVDELVLDAHGAIVRGPTTIVDSMQTYLWSPPRPIATATRTLASWSTNPGGAPSTYQIRETCGGP